MDGAIGMGRELTPEEIELVGGAYSNQELFAAMFTGGVAGAMGAAATGAGIGVGAMGGALIGGAVYIISDIMSYCL